MTFKTLLVRFGDGKHRFYLESVCGSSTANGEALCTHCKGLVVQTKTQDVGTFPHGLVSGSYTKESHIYDSPWYLAKVGTYGTPSSTDIELAKMAQAKARTGTKTKTLDSLRSNDNPGSNGMATSCIPSTSNSLPSNPIVHGSTSTSHTSATVATPNPVEKKKRASPKKKVVVVPSTEVGIEHSILTQLGALHETIVTTLPTQGMAETMDAPLEVSRVVRIILRPFTHGQATYWRDGTTEKIYKRKSDGGLGEYVGRWDSNQDAIVHDAPDSDEE
jgi:hypothetical protein